MASKKTNMKFKEFNSVIVGAANIYDSEATVRDNDPCSFFMDTYEDRSEVLVANANAGENDPCSFFMDTYEDRSEVLVANAKATRNQKESRYCAS